MCTFPGCPEKAHHACTECGRDLCFWHFAESPRAQATVKTGEPMVGLVKVCHPKCASPYWTTGTREWRPSSTQTEARP